MTEPPPNGTGESAKTDGWIARFILVDYRSGRSCGGSNIGARQDTFMAE